MGASKRKKSKIHSQYRRLILISYINDLTGFCDLSQHKFEFTVVAIQTQSVLDLEN
jgi:hypothetical protein